MDFNKRVSAVTPSMTLAITAKANALKAAGEKVIGFGAGEPDFDTPEHIKEAAIKALRDGQTKYTPESGLLRLREAIAKKLQQENGLTYKPSQIVVNNGAKHSIFNTILALCRDGDEVIIPSPYWLSYPEMVTMAGGKPVFVKGEESRDFKITAEQLEDAITSRSRLFILNSPSNPIGNVYTRKEIQALATVAVRNKMLIISDEIYEKILYDGAEHVSAGALSKEIFERTITVNGFSKAFSMTGWRLGYTASSQEIATMLGSVQSHASSAPNTFAQWGAVAALEGPQDVARKMVKAFAERREALYKRLTSVQGITCTKPMGAFYMLPNISGVGLDSLAFTEHLLDKEKVAVVPGKPFGSDKHVRLSYACSLAAIEEGMNRLERFVRSL